MTVDWIDPVLAAPLLACTSLGMLFGFLGCYVVLQNKSLLGEALSHACYPGLVLGGLVSACFWQNDSFEELLTIFIGAALFIWLAEMLMKSMMQNCKFSSDAALCSTLASFFAAGLLLISIFQPNFPLLARRLQSLLLGQAATVSNTFATLSCLISIIGIGSMLLLARSIKVHLFDPVFGNLSGLWGRLHERLMLIVIILSLIVGARIVGVVLVSAFIVFPPLTARFWVRSFNGMTILSGLLGGMAGALGIYLAHTNYLIFGADGISKGVLPTGPTIILVASGGFFFSLFFAKRDGLIVREWRRALFQRRCAKENVLKSMLQLEERLQRSTVLFAEVAYAAGMNIQRFQSLLKDLVKNGDVVCGQNEISLTEQGRVLAKRLVRLHRLWELYLVELCKMSRERVHPSAEEMEHILTPEIERELDLLLHHPTVDPHHQPIPPADPKNPIMQGVQTHLRRTP